MTLLNCSKEDVEKDPVYIDRCGEVTQKRYDVLDNCFEILVAIYDAPDNGTFRRCIEQSEWEEIQLGDTYCYGQTLQL